jgi:hypothetical protein
MALSQQLYDELQTLPASKRNDVEQHRYRRQSPCMEDMICQRQNPHCTSIRLVGEASHTNVRFTSSGNLRAGRDTTLERITDGVCKEVVTTTMT